MTGPADGPSWQKPLVGTPTGAVDRKDQEIRVGDKVTFSSGKVIWTVIGGYKAAVHLGGRSRDRYYVKPYLLTRIDDEETRP